MQPVVIRTTNIQETIAPDDGDDLMLRLYAAIFDLTEEECENLLESF